MYANKILVFGLNDDQISEVKKCRPTKETEVVATDCETDLIAIPCSAIIVNGAAMTDQQAEDIRWYYEDVGDYAERMLVIGEQERLKGLGRAICFYQDYALLMESLKYVLLNLWARHKKASEYSERIAIAIKILRLIKTRPGISSKDLAENLSISKRSAQRYIETLRVAGEWIDYDPARHGWALCENKSLLLEDDL